VLALSCGIARGLGVGDWDGLLAGGQVLFMAAALASLWSGPSRGRTRLVTVSHFLALGFCTYAAVTALWSSTPVLTAGRAAVFALLLLLAFESARLRWNDGGLLRSDGLLLFWLVVLLTAAGGLLAIAHVPGMLSWQGRFVGLTANATVAGWLAAMVLPLGYELALSSQGRRRAGAILGCLTLVAGIVASGTRGATISLVVGLVAFHLLRSRRHRVLVVVLGALVVVVLSLASGLAGGLFVTGGGTEPSTVSDREGSVTGGGTEPSTVFDRGDSDVSSGRFEIWQIALQEWSDQPIAGTGFGDSSGIQAETGIPTMSAHNAYLTTLVETGLIGLVLLLALLASVFVWWRTRPALSLLAASVVVVLNGAFESSLVNLGSPVTLMSWLVLAGLAASTLARTEPQEADDAARPPTSVSMATYNGSAFVRAQLDSVLAEARDSDEVVIVDDESTDDTRAVIAGMGDPRIRLIPLVTNVGHVGAFERAISEARGRSIVLSDQDDVWVPGRLQVIESALDDSAVVVTEVGALGGDDDPSRRLEPSGPQQTLRNYISFVAGRRPYSGCAMAFRESFRRYLLPFPSGVEAHDHWIAIVGLVSGELRQVDAVTVLRRIHGDNLTPRQRRGLRAVLTTRITMARLTGIAWWRLLRL
jgi:O-antigen ligase